MVTRIHCDKCGDQVARDGKLDHHRIRFTRLSSPEEWCQLDQWDLCPSCVEKLRNHLRQRGRDEDAMDAMNEAGP